jgi:hypothetical protein
LRFKFFISFLCRLQRTPARNGGFKIYPPQRVESKSVSKCDGGDLHAIFLIVFFMFFYPVSAWLFGALYRVQFAHGYLVPCIGFNSRMAIWCPVPGSIRAWLFGALYRVQFAHGYLVPCTGFNSRMAIWCPVSGSIRAWLFGALYRVQFAHGYLVPCIGFNSRMAIWLNFVFDSPGKYVAGSFIHKNRFFPVFAHEKTRM